METIDTALASKVNLCHRHQMLCIQCGTHVENIPFIKNSVDQKDEEKYVLQKEMQTILIT